MLENAGSVPLAGIPVVRRPEASVALPPGSTLLFYTDGLVERRGEGLETGFARLASALADDPRRTPDDLADHLVRALVPDGAVDDLALLVYRRPARAERPFSMDLAANPVLLRQLRRALQSWLADAGVDETTTYDILVAVTEACTNSMEHAYRLDASSHVRVRLRLEHRELVIIVQDEGTWRPPAENPGSRGRGLSMIRGLMDDVTVDSGPEGTTVTMRKLLHEEGPA